METDSKSSSHMRIKRYFRDKDLKMSPTLTIGKLSAKTGVKVPTIRYYESIGLIPEAPRTASDRRLYGAESEQVLGFIRHARDLGFSIEAIRALLDMARDPTKSCEEVNAIAERQLEDVEHRIRQLTALRDELQRMSDSCKGGSVGECGVLECLADHGLCIGTHGAV